MVTSYPWIAGLISPITVFISIVYVTSRMAAHTEIIAILSSGVSFKRLLVPYFLAALVIAALSFYLTWLGNP
jgi:lipopolysaccharide export system permease protein